MRFVCHAAVTVTTAVTYKRRVGGPRLFSHQRLCRAGGGQVTYYNRSTSLYTLLSHNNHEPELTLLMRSVKWLVLQRWYYAVRIHYVAFAIDVLSLVCVEQIQVLLFCLLGMASK